MCVCVYSGIFRFVSSSDCDSFSSFVDKFRLYSSGLDLAGNVA